MTRRLAAHRPAWRRLHRLVAALAVLVAACTGTTAGAGDVRAEAAPLLAAHALLEQVAALADADPAAAIARWPALDADVQAALDGADPRGSALRTEDRSLLVGYLGGLRLARDAWAEVVAALEGGGDPEPARRRATTRMAQLDRLRAGVLVPPSDLQATAAAAKRRPRLAADPV